MMVLSGNIGYYSTTDAFLHMGGAHGFLLLVGSIGAERNACGLGQNGINYVLGASSHMGTWKGAAFLTLRFVKLLQIVNH